MNFTENNLYRYSRRSLKKPDAPRLRQKKYFAKARALATGVDENHLQRQRSMGTKMKRLRDLDLSRSETPLDQSTLLHFENTEKKSAPSQPSIEERLRRMHRQRRLRRTEQSARDENREKLLGLGSTSRLDRQHEGHPHAVPRQMRENLPPLTEHVSERQQAQPAPLTQGGSNARTRKYTNSSHFERQLRDQDPNLVHPVPLRAIPSHVYSLDPQQSAYSGSAVAQVGRSVSPVPLSQAEENRDWRRWLGNSTASFITEDATVCGRLSPNKVAISPGISERRQPREWSQTISTIPDIALAAEIESDCGETRDASNIPSSSDFSEILAQYESIVSGLGLWESHKDFGVEEPHILPPDSRSTDLETNATRNAVCLTPLAILRAPGEGEEAPDEAWKRFVFGDDNTDELEHAITEATQDAARNMQSSDCLTCTTEDEEPHSEWDSVLAVRGTPSAGLLGAPNTASGNLSSAVIAASREATLAPSSAEMLSDLTPSSSHATTLSSRVLAEAGSNMSPGDDRFANQDREPWPAASAAPDGSDHESLSDHATVTPSVGLSTVTSMAVEPARSVGGNEPQFRFAPPKLFVGNRSTPNNVIRPTGAAVPLSFARKRRGRPKKRAHDGRADIRALPNYAGDPIEEIEDDDVTQPSLFGTLEFA
ncbi:hypothetical protein B0T16DRAFT_443568 [Cercophora newfieldiana]|uniref:Uncharacterized protein n=1 Tax=Cercophora newfieldiana TaxID=92897 RepID=A0AA40CUU4_9PEZI|nr:hypothetical protein B0T16DRAFT_443568 [Cercophora newfieldiana]